MCYAQGSVLKDVLISPNLPWKLCPFSSTTGIAETPSKLEFQRGLISMLQAQFTGILRVEQISDYIH